MPLTEEQWTALARDERARRVASRVAERASALAAPESADAASDDCGSGLLRVSYWHGRLLSADDLRAAQD